MPSNSKSPNPMASSPPKSPQPPPSKPSASSDQPPSNSNPSPPPLQTLPGSSSKPSKHKGRTKKPRRLRTTQIPIPVSSAHLSSGEKDCLVKAMALTVGEHIASRGNQTPDNVLDEIRADQITIAEAQMVLENPYKGKGKSTDSLEPSRNMLTSIAEWLKQECMETERLLNEMAEGNARAPRVDHSSSSKGPSTSKEPLPPTPEPKPTPVKRKPKKKQTSETLPSPSPSPNLPGSGSKA